MGDTKKEGDTSVELNLIEEGRSEPRTIQYDGWSHTCSDGMRLLTWDTKYCRDCGALRPDKELEGGSNEGRIQHASRHDR